MLKKICVFIIMCATVLTVALPASSSRKDVKPQPLSPVMYVRERSFAELAQFGLEARAYTFMLGGKRIVFGLGFYRNLTGITEELPPDIVDHVVNAIGKISPQFGTYRKYDGPIGPGMGPLIAPPAPDPKVDFWISGSLQGASEVYKDETKTGVDVTAGNGEGATNAHVGRNRTQTTKSLTVTFSLAGPDRVSIPGASASYRIDVQQFQRQRSYSVYVAGNGISRDNTVTITSSLQDALFDATADAMIHIIGNALLIPYYRCSSVFQPDPQLDSRVRDTLQQLTKQDLEQNLKVLMLIDGYPVSTSDLLHLTDHDRAVVEVEMYHRKLPYNDASLVDLAFSLWRDLDYVNGSQRVEQLLTAIARKQKEEQLAREQQAAAEAAAKQKQEQLQKQAAEAAVKEKEEQQKQAAEGKPHVSKSANRRRLRNSQTTTRAKTCDAVASTSSAANADLPCTKRKTAKPAKVDKGSVFAVGGIDSAKFHGTFAGTVTAANSCFGCGLGSTPIVGGVRIVQESSEQK